MTATPNRDRKVLETRARISQAALDLFAEYGFAETTIDEIAEAAGVGRRTVFRHFATKEAMLFDQLAVRREVAIRSLEQRPAIEPTLVSLLAVLRELAEHGYDRQLLGQIRAVFAADPLAAEQLSAGNRSFEQQVMATLNRRGGKRQSSLENKALTHMALGWFATAAHMYLTESRRRSLRRCFDEVVAVCVEGSASISAEGLGSASELPPR